MLTRSITHADNTLWNHKSFPNKVTPDEDIILLVREDIVILFAKGLSLICIFFALLLARTIALGLAQNVAVVAVFDTIFYTINTMLITYFVLQFHNYYLSLQILTTARVIDIDQKGIFTREVNELPINGIEDASYKQNGFFGTVFNFGNVILQTAGTGGSTNSKNPLEDKINGFVFNNVPNPSEICNLITKYYHKGQHRDILESAEANAFAMKDFFNQNLKK